MNPVGLVLPAHGIGGATDLPIPFTTAIIGASWALTISFAVLALAWKEPRLQADGPAAAPPPRRPRLAVLGLLLDPFGRGWEPFGELSVSYVLSRDPELLASLKVTAVVVGHIIAVLAAHDRALVVLPRSHRLTGQLAMLFVMIAFTFTGLWLLFSV